jgi:hypothetical protein
VANYIARVGNRRLRNRTIVMFAPLCQQLPTRFGIWSLDSRGVIRKEKPRRQSGLRGLRFRHTDHVMGVCRHAIDRTAPV